MTFIFKSMLMMAMVLSAACAGAADAGVEGGPVQRAVRPSDSGMELFSWHNKGDDAWHFALLPAPGIDKLKSVEVVTSKENVLDDVDALKRRIAALALNEKIGWFNMLEKKEVLPDDVVFDFPPREITKDLEIYCTILKVRLNIYRAGAKKAAN